MLILTLYARVFAQNLVILNKKEFLPEKLAFGCTVPHYGCSENKENEDFAAISQIKKLVGEQFRKRCCQISG